MDATIVENSLGNRRSTKINWKSLPGTYTSSCRFLSFSNSQVSESYACFQPEDLRGDQAVDGPIRASAEPYDRRDRKRSRASRLYAPGETKRNG